MGERQRSHRQFINDLLQDETRFRSAIDQLTAALPKPLTELAPLTDPARIDTERMKALLTLIGSQPYPAAAHTDLQRLWSICKRSAETRTHLLNVDVWKDFFRRYAPHLQSPDHVKQVLPGGRCNLHYRLSTGRASYVARYHDPLGRHFLQRHEPRKAVAIYSAASALFELCLGPTSIIPILYPEGCSAAETAPRTDEDTGDPVEILADRVLIHQDCHPSHMLLSESLQRQRGNHLFVGPLARLHAASRDLYTRRRFPSPTDSLVIALRSFQHLERFPRAGRYAAWLRDRNWIARRLRATTTPSTTSSVRLPTALSYSPPELLALWEEVSERSVQAVHSLGSLAHLDYTPLNCFVKTSNPVEPVVFDFDYVVVLDPAYDLAIATSSFINTVLRHRSAIASRHVTDTVDALFDEYKCGYVKTCNGAAASSISPVGEPELGDFLRRARVFAGLAQAVTSIRDVDQRQSTSHDQTKAAVVEYLFRFH